MLAQLREWFLGKYVFDLHELVGLQRHQPHLQALNVAVQRAEMAEVLFLELVRREFLLGRQRHATRPAIEFSIAIMASRARPSFTAAAKPRFSFSGITRASGYSLRYGASSPATLVERVKRTLGSRPRLSLSGESAHGVLGWVEATRVGVVASLPALVSGLHQELDRQPFAFRVGAYAIASDFPARVVEQFRGLGAQSGRSNGGLVNVVTNGLTAFWRDAKQTEALGIILDFLAKEGPSDKVQALLDSLPGADAAIAAARERAVTARRIRNQGERR